MQRRLALQRQLLQVDRNTEASLTECESKSREVARLSSQLSTERKQLSEKRQKMLLYESYAKEMVRFMHILRKYAERLRAFVAECKSIATDRRPYMGTAHSQVQQTLSMLEAVIAEALKSGRDDINRTSWTALKEKLQGSTPLDFLQLMMRNVDEAMEHVHQCESGTTADTHADIWLGKLQTYLEVIVC
ncbi:hypothetical protein BC832DRAFT_388311 [Gaertneriomyces semiglobifer]|nr:hypothetical protein BC832DRAFT_388311 [Gaertneriomyces semiglobifer]